MCMYTRQSIKRGTPVGAIMFLQNVSGGFMVAFGVLGVISISNGISTYLLDGQTLESKIKGRVGQ